MKNTQKDPDEMFYDIIKSYMDNERPDAEEQADFEAWISDEEHYDMKMKALDRAWDEMVAKTKGRTPAPDNATEFERLKKRLGIEEAETTEAEGNKENSDTAETVCEGTFQEAKRVLPMNGKSHRLLRFWQSAAAVLVACVGILSFLLLQKEPAADLIQRFTPVAAMHHVTLPDGTDVQLNSTSTLLYPNRFTGDTRSVYLVGEANFKVKPDPKHPFIVKSDDFQVTALGTEFNVTAWAGKGEISTVLLSGSVKVECNDLKQYTLLRPGEQITYDKERHTCLVDKPDLKDATAWQRGEIVIKDLTLCEIISVLKRKYDYEFVYRKKELSGDRYRFRLRDDAPLREVMEIITDVAGNLSFEITGNKCHIRMK